MKKHQTQNRIIKIGWMYLLIACISINLSSCKAFLQSLASTQVGPHQEATPEPPINCPDVELIGLAATRSDALDITVWGAKLRNKAPYTKNITVQWIDKYGQKKQASFNIKSGEMTNGEIARTNGSEREPQDLKIISCY